MGCGCKNCNGTVTSSGQLPPGCDSILNITTDNTGDEILVTIAFCSGGVQQFSIPVGSDGLPGGTGSSGADGADGVGIVDVTATVENNIVTLTFLLSNGATLVETFEIDVNANPPAYIIDHKGLDVPNEINVQAGLQEGVSSVIASSIIPADIFQNTEDTIYFDILVNLVYSPALGGDKMGTNIFSSLNLEINTSASATGSGLIIPLRVSSPEFALFPTQTLKFSGTITRRAYLDALENLSTSGIDVIIEAEAFGRKAYTIDEGTFAGEPTVNTKKAMGWKSKASEMDLNSDNYFKITASGVDYTVDETPYAVNANQIYFVTRFLPRI